MEGTFRQIQLDEKIAIESIYGEDAAFVKSAWEVWQPLDVTVHLEPHHTGREESDVFVTADLHIKCSEVYPQRPPKLDIPHSKGLSNMQVSDLCHCLEAKCMELIGNPMVMELCEIVRTFLSDNNKPPQGSFHDVMLRYKETQDFLYEMEKERKEARAKEAILEERERQKLEAELRNEQAGFKGDVYLEKRDEESGAILRVLGDRKVIVRKEILTRPRHPYCSEYYAYEKAFSEQSLLISEFTIHCSARNNSKAPRSTKDKKYCVLLEKLDEIEMLGRRLSMSSFDETIVPYHFVYIEKISLSPINFHVKIHVAQQVEQEEICFSECYNTVRKKDFMRRLATSAICALKYLHDQKLSHGYIVPHSVWCSKATIRFSDACLKRPILNLCEYFKYYIGEDPYYNYDDDKVKRNRDLRDLALLLEEVMGSMNFLQVEDSPDLLREFANACAGAKNVEELVHHQYFNNIDVVPDLSVDSPRAAVKQSDTRLSKEFIIQRCIGAGAFGEVFQARNKLDWSNYAVKCITLPNDQFSRTITREAKFFSKLNHPNIVRYFNAWIESVTVLPKRSVSPHSPEREESPPHRRFDKDDSMLPSRLRNLEHAAEGLEIEAREWTASCRGEMLSSSEDESEEDEESEEDSPHSGNTDGQKEQSSIDVLFEDDKMNSSTTTSSLNESGEASFLSSSSDPKTPSKMSPSNRFKSSASVRVLYIQMEYCGGGTLRKYIDNSCLFGKPNVIWKLFAEILCGLGYIHRQGMIHRDIKPTNIMLDDEGHIKIGDFGLATKGLLLLTSETTTGAFASGSAEQALTKDIGTELYMAPELNNLEDPEPYTSKIDVYSTGIVFFEMCHRPMRTIMERHSIIKELKKLLLFPDDFGSGFSASQAKHLRELIRKMVNPEASLRPTVEEILRDSLVPPVDYEDKQFKGVFNQSVKSRNRTYYWMLDTLTREEQPPARAFCFDQDICTEKFVGARDGYIERLRDELSSILRTHAFVPFYSHLLVPKTYNTVQSWETMHTKPVVMLDSFGNTVMLPIDLRLNFVRYCARNAINRMKRYSFERVYTTGREGESVHPLEAWDCSIDCIGLESSASTLTADLLTLVTEIASKVLSEYRCSLRIGHMSLMSAAMKYVGIKPDAKKKVLRAIQSNVTPYGVNMTKIMQEVGELVGDTLARQLFAILPKESSLSVFKEKCKNMLRSRDEEVRECARLAISDLQNVMDLLGHAANLDTIAIVFDASVLYNPSSFSDGIVFLLSCTLPCRKRAGTMDVTVLFGGRYDSLLKNELHPQDLRPAHSLCLVGMSIWLHALAEIKRKYSNEKLSICEALVCSYSLPLLAEKFELAKLLRIAGVSTDVIHEAVNGVPDILDHCLRSNIENLLVVFAKDEVLLMSSGVDQGKMTFAAVVERLRKKSDEVAPAKNDTVTPATFANCAVVYAIMERPAANTKKKIENQIRVALVNKFAQFSSNEKIVILVTSLPVEVIKSVTSSLNRRMTIEEVNLAFDGLSRTSGKSKEELECLYEHVKKIFTSDQRPAIIVYRHQDGFSQVLA